MRSFVCVLWLCALCSRGVGGAGGWRLEIRGRGRRGAGGGRWCCWSAGRRGGRGERAWMCCVGLCVVEGRQGAWLGCQLSRPVGREPSGRSRRGSLLPLDFVSSLSSKDCERCIPGSSSGDVLSPAFGPPETLRFAAMVTSTTIFRSCKTSHANLPEKVRGLNCPLNPSEFWMQRQSWIVVFRTRTS